MKLCPSDSSKEINVSLIKETFRHAVALLYCTSSLHDSQLLIGAGGGLAYGTVSFYTNMKTEG